MFDFWKKSKLGRILRRALAAFTTTFLGQLAIYIQTSQGGDAMQVIMVSMVVSFLMAAEKAAREFAEKTRMVPEDSPGSPPRIKAI